LQYIYPRTPWRTSRPINRRNLPPSKVNSQHFKTVHFFTFSFIMLRQLCSTGSGSAVPADQNQCWSGSTTLTEGHATGQTGKSLNEESLLTIKVRYCNCTSYIDMYKALHKTIFVRKILSYCFFDAAAVGLNWRLYSEIHSLQIINIKVRKKKYLKVHCM
jgi:hypothetical protein